MSISKWSFLPAMTSRRSNACAVALYGKAIVIGGNDGGALNSCEACQFYMPDFYKFLLLAKKIRECGEKATMTYEEEGDALRMILWMRVSLLPWDIVVHVVRFVETPTGKTWCPIPSMIVAGLA